MKTTKFQYGQFAIDHSPLTGEFVVNPSSAEEEDHVDVLFPSFEDATLVLDLQKVIRGFGRPEGDHGYANPFEVISLEDEGHADVYRIVDHAGETTGIPELVFQSGDEDLMLKTLLKSVELEINILMKTHRDMLTTPLPVTEIIRAA